MLLKINELHQNNSISYTKFCQVVVTIQTIKVTFVKFHNYCCYIILQFPQDQVFRSLSCKLPSQSLFYKENS